MKLEWNFYSMQRRFEGIFRAIDDYFESKEESEKRLLYVMPALVIVVLSYLYLLPLTETWLADKRAILNQERLELTKSQAFVQMIDRQGGMEAERQEVEKVRENLDLAEQKVQWADETLARVYKESQAWYFTLDFATKEAANLGLEMMKATFEDEASHKKKLQEAIQKATQAEATPPLAPGVGGMEKSWMSLEGRGDSRAVLGYLHALEQQGRFVSLERIELAPREGRLGFSVTLGNQRGRL